MPRLSPSQPTFSLVWASASALAVGFVALAFVPPFVDGFARGGLMHAYSFVCHQLPERSFAIGSGHMALCHRCTGILGGFALGLVVSPLAVGAFVRAVRAGLSRVDPGHRAAVAFALAGLPTLIDWGLGASGLWTNTAGSRLLTGAVLGIVAGLLVGRAALAPGQPSSPSPSPRHAV